MRFEGTRPSGVDKQVDVFIFTIGKEERRLLHEVVAEAYRKMPKITETQIPRARLKQMERALALIPSNHEHKPHEAVRS